MWPSIHMLPVLVLQATQFGICVYEHNLSIGESHRGVTRLQIRFFFFIVSGYGEGGRTAQ